MSEILGQNSIVFGSKQSGDDILSVIGRNGGGARVRTLSSLAVSLVIIFFEHFIQILIPTDFFAE